MRCKPRPTLFPYTTLFRSNRKIPSELKLYVDILGDPENFRLTSASQALSDLPLVEPGQPEMERSEEHTSELQSRQYLVCRLLLEKKKIGSVRIKCSESK